MSQETATAYSPLAAAPLKPLEEPTGTETAAALLQNFTKVPSISRAWAFPCREGINLALEMSLRNLPANSQRKYLSQFQLTEAVLEAGDAEPGLPIELSGIGMYAPSPSGRRTLVVRGAPSNGGNDTSVILEIWDRSKVIHEIHVPKAMHGGVYNDGWFGTGAAWSPDETKIAYVAEAPVAVQTPKWGGKQGAGDDAQNGAGGTAAAAAIAHGGAGPKAWRGIGAFEEDWGELNTGKRPPAIFVLDVSTGDVAVVQGTPKETSCGQPQWSPNSDALLFVSWEHSAQNFPDFPRRLGIVYCFNRPCALHAVSWPQPARRGEAAAAVRLTPPSLGSAFSPRFTPDGSTLVFLSQHTAVSTGVHNATPASLSLPWEPLAATIAASSSVSSSAAGLPQPRTVVDVVYNPASIDAFQGMYCTTLLDHPFVDGASSTIMVATVQWRSNNAIVAIDIATGEVTRLSPTNGSSWTLLAARDEWLVASESHPGQPCKVFACHISERQRSQPETWSWSRVEIADVEDLPDDVEQALSQIQTEIMQIQPTVGNETSPGTTFEAVVLKRRDALGPLPTVLTPHGGPHTCYSAQYFMPLSFLVASGYCVVLVNYRGSTGFGETSLQSLPGHIGTNDVSDCMTALQAAVDAGYADPQRVAAVGGSHGGFLSAHLAGQHASAFKAAVLRNPVCDLSLMVHLSDIPDWCFIESWGTEQGCKRAGSGPSPEDLQKFAEVSPRAHVDNVTAPVLMMLGACDRRVPLDDGKRYLETLRKRENAPESRLIVFPQDTHALDKPQTEFEQWITALWWLEKHVNNN